MLSLLESLISIPSTTGEETDLALALERMLSARGYRVYRQHVTQDRFNVLALTDQSPGVVLCTHMDTVPPYKAFKQKTGWIWGRGSCDAKGSMAAMITAADELREAGEHRFGLLFVVGEEFDSDGARIAAKNNPGSHAVILGEPTDNRLAVAQKGSMVFRMTARGDGGHSAGSGASALHRLIRRAQQLLDTGWGQDPLLGTTTLNIGTLQGGDAVNVIASTAELEGIFRLAGPPEPVRKKLLSAADDSVTIEILSVSEPQRFNSVDGFETTVVGFGSDAAWLRPLGPVYLVGPGSIRYAHQSGERIQIRQLEEAVSVYRRLVMRLIH
jgi:acetylornithine deacetylase